MCVFGEIHKNPEELVVNTNQTYIHLALTSEIFMWEKNEYVNVQGLGDKCQINVVGFSATNGNILHFQLIFQCLIPRSILPKNDEYVASGGTDINVCGKKLTPVHDPNAK